MTETTNNAEIYSVSELLNMNLSIPEYQRPYKWTQKNVLDLLHDIKNAIQEAQNHGKFKYRIGTIIIHRDGDKNYIVDGQQRIVTLSLLLLNLQKCNSLLNNEFNNKISQNNIQNNYRIIHDWLANVDDNKKLLINNAMKNILEVVVITVTQQAEAFQLFDSQNTRGKELAPHDLLKAYHLREMKNKQHEMLHAVTKWEAVSSKDIKELFEYYLFPIYHWARDKKSISFSIKHIDIYKGISENSSYTYAKHIYNAMPYFQITDSIIAGNDFFEMVEYYLQLLNDIKSEIRQNDTFKGINDILEDKQNISVGFCYVKNLFYCAVLCYYDRFKNFDVRAIKKLFSWAFMLRIDMEKIAFDCINRYAIGMDGYSNAIPMFSKISDARLHDEIATTSLTIKRDSDIPRSEKWRNLYEKIKKMNGY